MVGRHPCANTGRTLTNVQGVIITAKAIQDSLLGSNLILGDIVCFAILGSRFALGRASNHFREFFTGGLGTEVEARTLGISQSHELWSDQRLHTNKRAYATPFLSTRVDSRSTIIPLSG